MKSRLQSLWLIISLAVIVRLAFVVIFGSTLSLKTSGYDDYAVNLIAGHDYTRFADLHPDSDLPPLYPFFLAGVYLILGRSAITVALVQIVFDVITIAVLYAIGRRIAGPSVGLIAAALLAFYPYLLFQNLTVNDTGLFIMLLALGIWAAYHVQTGQNWRWVALAGLFFGTAALTKTLVILMLPLLALSWLVRFKLRGLLPITAMGLIFVAVITPWIVRNTLVQKQFTLLSTNDGSNLYQGNNPCVADLLLAGWDAQWSNCLNPEPPGLTEVQSSAWFRDQALAYLSTHVDQIPRLMAAKLITLWSPDIMPHNVPPFANLANDAVLQYETPAFVLARSLHVLYFTPLLILGIAGLYLGWRDHLDIWLIVSVFITITVAYLIYHPSTRYRSPADPFLFVLSAYGLSRLQIFYKTITSRKHNPGTIGPSISNTIEK